MNPKSSTSPVVKSMTGFAKVSGECAGVDIDVEVKSVNHRFLEVSLKGVSKAGTIERDLKGIFQQLHSRGRIEVVVTRRMRSVTREATMQLENFDPYVAMYVAACKRYGARVDDVSSFIASLVVREGFGQVDTGEVSEEEHELLQELSAQASRQLFDSRQREGTELVKDIQARLKQILAIRRAVEKQMSGASKRVKARLLERVAAIAPEVKIQPDRLAAEVALLAERVDVSEELVRLGIHLEQFATLLKTGEPSGIGRKLDFITQEIGRELNTIGSKAQDGVVQGHIVDAKSELEKIREQVQNLE